MHRRMRLVDKPKFGAILFKYFLPRPLSHQLPVKNPLINRQKRQGSILNTMKRSIIKRRRKKAPQLRWLRTFFSIFIIFLIIAFIYEIHTSHLQSWLFSYIASNSSYQVEAGPSPSIVFPQSGPFNTRRGYSQILKFENRFKTHGYKIVQQARFSPQMSWLAKLGITPPYPEPYTTGLVITDANGTIIYDAISRNQLFNDIEEIPPLITNTLLFIEDRGLNRQIDTRNNPVINWSRFLKACFLYGANKLGFPIQV